MACCRSTKRQRVEASGEEGRRIVLPSGARLKRRSSFSAAYAKGRSYASDLIVVYVRPNRCGVTRFGFTVSRKLGKAVARNRVRRVLREAARTMLHQVRPGYDIVVVARVAMAEAEFGRVRARFVELLGKTGVLKVAEEAT